MKARIGAFVAAGVVAAAGFAGIARGAEAAWDVSLWSKYLWRGQVYTDDPVLQPSLDVVADCGVGFNMWMNIDLTDANESAGDRTRGRPTEIDFTVYYGLPLDGWLQAEIGAATYVISEPAEMSGSTADTYLKVWIDPATVGEDSWLALLPTPSAAVYYDFVDVEDFYFMLGLESSFDLSDTLSLGIAATLGYGLKDYNAYYFDSGDIVPLDGEDLTIGPRVNEAAFNDLSVNVELAWQATESLSLALMGQYTAMIENPVKEAAKVFYGDSDWLLGGVKASWTF